MYRILGLIFISLFLFTNETFAAVAVDLGTGVETHTGSVGAVTADSVISRDSEGGGGYNYIRGMENDTTATTCGAQTTTDWTITDVNNGASVIDVALCNGQSIGFKSLAYSGQSQEFFIPEKLRIQSDALYSALLHLDQNATNLDAVINFDTLTAPDWTVEKDEDDAQKFKIIDSANGYGMEINPNGLAFEFVGSTAPVLSVSGSANQIIHFIDSGTTFGAKLNHAAILNSSCTAVLDPYLCCTGSGTGTCEVDYNVWVPTGTGTLALVPGSDTELIFNQGGTALGAIPEVTYAANELTLSTGLNITFTDSVYNPLNIAHTTVSTSSQDSNEILFTVNDGAAAMGVYRAIDLKLDIDSANNETVAKLVGLGIEARHRGTGLATDVIGAEFSGTLSNAEVAINATNLIALQLTAGTYLAGSQATNAIGLNILDIGDADTTNDYAIRQLGTDDTNSFAGPIIAENTLRVNNPVDIYEATGTALTLHDSSTATGLNIIHAGATGQAIAVSNTGPNYTGYFTRDNASATTATVIVWEDNASSDDDALRARNDGTGDIFKAQDGTAIVFTVADAGNVVLGNAALATTATDGFLYLTTTAGAPTGDTTDFTGRLPMVYDSTNDTLCINTSTTVWKCVTLA